MPTRLTAPVLIASAALLVAASPARATYPDHVGTRALGMGGAMRAFATGDAGPALNPSGISLVNAYVLETAYQFVDPIDSHAGRVSVVDSTSSSKIGGALYYDYMTRVPAAGVEESAHEGGASLSVPFLDRFYLGATLKYISHGTNTEALGGARTRQKGLTYDLGATLRPIPAVSLAVVGYNLRDIGTAAVARAVGFGAAVNAVAGLLVVLDGVIDFVENDPSRDNVTTLGGGAEYAFFGRFAVRAGGGRDGWRDSAYVSGGASLLTDVGALDVGVRRDLAGDDPFTYIGASARLFVPSP